MLAGAAGPERQQDARWFFACLAVCHSVQVEVQPDAEPTYSGSSADEVSFVEVATAIGVVYRSRRRNPATSAWELLIDVTSSSGGRTEGELFRVHTEIPCDSDRYYCAGEVKKYSSIKA